VRRRRGERLLRAGVGTPRTGWRPVSHHRVPSLSKAAFRSGGGTNPGPGVVTDRTNSTMAAFAAPGRHDGSGSLPVTAAYSRASMAWASRSRLTYGSPLTSTATRWMVPPVKWCADPFG
jgi:hypothetical protein